MTIAFDCAVAIDRPPSEVFAALTDLRTWPRWASTVESFVPEGPGPLGAGSAVVHTSCRGDRRIVTRFVVTALAPHETFGIESPHLRCAFTLAPDGPRTVLRTRFEAEARGATALLYRLFLKRWAAADLGRFKGSVEGRER